jgi:hypothetical protein
MPVDVGESTAVNESISSVAEKESPTSLYVVTISDIAPTAFSERILSDICQDQPYFGCVQRGEWANLFHGIYPTLTGSSDIEKPSHCWMGKRKRSS